MSFGKLTKGQLDELNKICAEHGNGEIDCRKCPVLIDMGWCPLDNLTFCGNMYHQGNILEVRTFLETIHK